MGIKGTAELKHEIARQNVDRKIVELWLMLQELHQCGSEYVHDDDKAIWHQASMHIAVHRKLSRDE